MILINSLPRHGGSLLARLLESHSRLVSYPAEMPFTMSKYEWPDLTPYLESRDLEALLEKLPLQAVITFSRFGGGTLRYQERTFKLNYEEFLSSLRALLKAQASLTYKSVYLSLGEAFFGAWGAPDKWHKPGVDFLVNHCASACFFDASHFFKEFPDGFIIQTLRDPRAYYTSEKKWVKRGRRNIRDNDYEFLVKHCYAWRKAALIGIQNQKHYPERYLTIRFESLILDGRETLEKICRFLGLPFEDNILTPTLGGKPWYGDSSFGKFEGGVSRRPLGSWVETLTHQEVSFIEQWQRDLMTHLEYELTCRPSGELSFLVRLWVNFLWSAYYRKRQLSKKYSDPNRFKTLDDKVLKVLCLLMKR